MPSRLIVGGDLMLYGDVAGGMFSDPATSFSARDVVEALAELGSSAPITVRINSPGGHVFEGVAIYHALLGHRGPVSIAIDGVAASAASVIAMAGLKSGNELVMWPGAQLMIHRPMGDTFGGTAEDHEKNAAMLDQLEEQVAGIYAAHTGLSEKEIRSLLDAETWLTAEDAVAFGFATRVASIDDSGTEGKPNMADSVISKKAPAMVAGVTMSAGDGIDEASEVAAVAEPETEAANEVVEVEAVEPPVVVAKAKPRIDVTAAIFARCAAGGLTMAQTQNVIAKAGGSLDKASQIIINTIADKDSAGGQRMPSPARVVADVRDRFIQGASMAIMARAGLPGGERNEYTSMTMREIALESLRVNNVTQRFNDPMTMISAAMRPHMVGLSIVPRMDGAGLHSTSDFAEITGNVANKSMLKGFEEAEETFERWTSRGTLTDFKVATRVDMGVFPSLAVVPEGTEYKYVTTSDRSQTVVLSTYGQIFGITRQAVVNDDLSVFTRIPSRMGRAARRTVGDLVYALLTANAAMPDTIALFHASHGNLVAGTPGDAPTVASVTEAKVAMATQQDDDQYATALNIRPSYLICPVALETTARVLAAAQYDPAATLGTMTPNPHSGTFEVVADARLDADDSAAWYMAANPNSIDTIEVLYLNGVNTPTMEQRDGFVVDGIEYKIRLDAAAQVFDYRGLFKNEGA
jgi:ATP-dependent protease ClpP protease subunit